VAHMSAQSIRRLPIGRLALTAAAGLVAAGAIIVMNPGSRPPSPITVDQRIMIDKIESVLLHDSDLFQYDRVVDQYDGRGYVAGRGDFSVANGEALAVVETYTASVPDNALGQTYLPALRTLAAQRSAADTGLEGYPDAWRRASSDRVFREAQDTVMNDRYFAPAQRNARALGITSPLGVAVLYDSIIQHGDGTDPDSLSVIIARTKSISHGQPGQGIEERAWLGAFLDVRTDVLTRPANPARRESWPYTIGRVRALRDLLAGRHDNLAAPLAVNPFGTVHILEPTSGKDAPPQAVGPPPTDAPPPTVAPSQTVAPTVAALPTPTSALAPTTQANPQATATAPAPRPTVQPPQPIRIDFSDFASVSGLVLNGSAAGTGTALRLTNGPQAAGSAWAETRIDTGRSFTTSFRFSVPDLADGMAFLIQRQGPAALGSAGGGMGYGGHPDRPTEARIVPSLAVEFDMWDNSSEGWDPPGHQHVAVTTNGDIRTHLSWADPGFCLDGEPVGAWLEYDAASKTLAVYVSRNSARPAKPMLTATVDIAAVGTGPAYVGFTAGTGDIGRVIDVLNWHLTA
jgi:Glycosyl hydrolase family 46/Legume lectin domain